MLKNKASLKDVCREASVSEATVSRVINNSPLVREATRQRVMEAVEKLGYTPNAAARNLSRSKTDTIGIVFHQMSSGFFASVMAGIDKAARDHGYHVLSVFPHSSTDACDTCLNLFKEARVDGLVLLDPALNMDTILRLKKHKRPMVLIQRDLDDDQVNTVSVKNKEGAYEAVRHLVGHGYKDLLIILGPEGAPDSQLRTEGCKQALSEPSAAGIRTHYINGYYHPDRALEAFRDYREKHGLPRGIFCLNDAMALSVLKELRTTGVKVPEEVAIIGFDGIECADYVDLTTVETPMMALGEESVRSLMKRIANPESSATHTRLDVVLRCRATCGCAG